MLRAIKALCGRLRALRSNRYGRFALYVSASSLTTTAMLALYWVEVSVLDQNRYAVRPFNWPISTALSFAINLWVFGERKPAKKTSAIRWTILAAGISGLNFGLFWSLTQASLPYIQAQLITIVVIGLPHYLVSNTKKVFVPEEEVRST